MALPHHTPLLCCLWPRSGCSARTWLFPLQVVISRAVAVRSARGGVSNQGHAKPKSWQPQVTVLYPGLALPMSVW